MHKKLLILLYNIFFIFNLFAEHFKVDSLKNVLKNSDLSKIERIETINTLVKELSPYDQTTSIEYEHEALKLAEELNDSNYIAECFSNIGLIHDYATNYTLAEKYYLLAYNIRIRNNLTDETSEILNNLAGVYYNTGEFEKSIELFLKVLKIREEKKDENKPETLIQLAKTYNNVALVLKTQKIYPKAIYNYKQAIELKTKAKDFLGEINSRSNLGSLYINLDSFDLAQNQFEIAMHLSDSIGSKVSTAMLFNNLGMLHAKKKNYEKANFYYQQALELNNQIEDTRSKATTILNITTSYYRLKKYNKALEYEKELLDIAQKEGFDRFKLATYELLANIYENKDLNKSLLYYKKYIAFKDSIDNIELEKHINQKVVMFETEIKDNQISLLNIDNELKEARLAKNKWQLFGLAFGIIGLLSVLIILFRANQFKTKSNQLLFQKNKELTELTATKEKLFSVLAHDLRNPISAFRNIVGSLKNNLSNFSLDEVNEMLTHIYSSSENVFQLLQNILYWVFSQTNNIHVEPKKQQIYPLVENAYQVIQLNIDEKQMKIVNNVSKNCEAVVDTNVVQTILRNFISNAIKFSPINSEIIIEDKIMENKMRIYVKDEGIGLSDKDVKKLFSITENVTEIGNSSEKGTGLGLILCKELALKMGADIGVESTLGKGSNFYIEFNL